MEKCIKAAKRLIDKQVMEHKITNGISFTSYNKSYYSSNENVSAYLGLVDYNGKNNALSVLASGDQAFNLITNGITNIDTFDINILSAFIALGLKRAMILRYSYQEYLNFAMLICSNTISHDDLTNILRDLLPYMDKYSERYWSEIVDYNYTIQKAFNLNLNLLQMLCVNTENLASQIACNNYLQSEDKYNLLRSRLGNANITFKQANAMSLGYEFEGKYDFILLSNVLDYFDCYLGDSWNYSFLQNYYTQLERLANDDAVIFLHYIFDYIPDLHVPLFDGSAIFSQNLIDEQVIPIEGDFYNKDAAVILRRVKKCKI